MRGFITSGAVALAALLSVCGPTARAERALSPDETRAAAAISVSQGRNAQALALTDALLARDPLDVDALVSRSRALRNLGDARGAQSAARTAFTAARDDLQRYAAAMAMAQALSSDGKRTRAQLWLRRAAQAAPSKAAEVTAARDYRYVARRNPVQVQFSFGVTPSDNINNGSRHDSLLLDVGGQVLEVPFSATAMPLSGTELSTGAVFRYRLSESADHALHAHLAAQSRSYRLSAQARQLAPTAQGSDFAYSSLATGLTFRYGPPATGSQLHATLDRATYGGALYADVLRVGTARRLPSPVGAVMVGLTAEHLHRHDIDATAQALGISAALDRPLPDGGQLRLSFAAEANRSDADVLDHTDTRARVSYALAEPVLGSDLTLDLALGWQAFDAYPTSPDGRRDRTTTLGATAVLRDVTFYGFNPTVRVERRVTDSTLRRQETEQTSLSLGFRSAF